MGHVRFRPLALKDVQKTTAYLSLNAGPNTARRFVGGVRAAAEFLASSPEIGAPCNFERSELAALRRWHVNDFDRWAIFYFALKDGIEVVRVLHGARDLDEIFDSAKQV